MRLRQFEKRVQALERQLIPGEGRRVLFEVEMWGPGLEPEAVDVIKFEVEDDGSPRFDEIFKNGSRRRGGVDD